MPILVCVAGQPYTMRSHKVFKKHARACKNLVSFFNTLQEHLARSCTTFLVGNVMSCILMKHICNISAHLHVHSLVYRFQLAVEVFDMQSSLLHFFAAGKTKHDTVDDQIWHC